MPKEDALATSPLSLMQEPRTTPLRVVAASPSSEPCCHPVESCVFKPSSVKWMMELLDDYAQSGMHPTEVLASWMTDRSDDHRPTAGPGAPKAAILVAELARAMQAGHRTPWAISRFLCPIGYEAACD